MNTFIRPLCISLFAICILYAACSMEVRKPIPTFPLLADSVSLEKSCMSLSVYLAAVLENTDTNSMGFFYRVLDSTAAALGRSLTGKASSTAAADSILAVVYIRWGIEFEPCDTAPQYLLPNLVYKNRKGACLGVSLIILMLAERLGCPVYGVVLPGHFFCRYDNGAQRYNIEPNREGVCHPDAYYAGRYPIARRPWYDLGNLSKRETIGVLCYNTGVLCLRKNLIGASISLFSEACCRMNEFAEARGNLALSLAQAGLFDSSMAVFERLFAAHPDMPGLAANYGSVAIAARRYRIARDVFRKGLQISPGDSTLVRGLAQACAHPGVCDSGKAK